MRQRNGGWRTNVWVACVVMLGCCVSAMAQVYLPDLLVSGGKAEESPRTLLNLRFERERLFADDGDAGIEGIKGNALPVEGYKGGGIRFNGVDTTVTIPSHPSFKAVTEGAFTVDFHLFMDKLPTTGDTGILGFAQPGFVIFTNPSGWLYAYLVTTEQPWHISVAQGLRIAVGVWHHVRFSYDGKGKIVWTLDGDTREDTSSTRGLVRVPKEDYTLVLGKYGRNYWSGILDEVRIMTGFATMTVESAEEVEKKSLTLYVPFDGTLEAAYAKGGKLPLYHDDSVHFTEGIKGKAVVVKGEGVAYEAGEHINRARGTVMFWFRGFDPTDYTARRYARYKSFFEVGSWNEAMRLYWPGNGIGMLFYEFICMGSIQKGFPLRMMPFNPEDRWIGRDTWHHIAATWINGEEARLYFDGRHIFTIDGPNLPAELSRDFVVGRGTPEMEIDELRVYSEALPAGIIRKRYDEFDLQRKKVPVSTSAAVGESGEARYAPTLAQEPWYDNKLGEEDWVPPPWEPVKVTGFEIATWGSRCDCGGILPKKVTLRDGTTILDGPVSLCIERPDGKEMALTQGKTAVTGRGEGFCTIESLAQGEGWSVKSSQRVEFDGFVLSAIEVTIAQDTQVGKIFLVIPLKREYAKYYNICGSWPSYLGVPSGRIPAGGMQKGFEPYVWVGDENRGFTFCTEENRYWVNRNTDRVIELVPQGNSMVVRINLCDEEIRFKAGQKLLYTFGFLATPSRPFVADRRSFRFISNNLKQVGRRGIEKENIVNVMPWRWSSPWMSFDPASPETFKAWEESFLGGCRNLRTMFKKVYCTPYLNFQKYGYQAKGEAERDWYVRYHDVMALAPASYNTWPHGENDWSKTFNFCPNSKAFCDFYLWSFKRFLNQAPTLNGVYIDETFTYVCVSDKHGCRSKNIFGEEVGKYPIFAHRELMKRMYKIAKKKDKDFLFWTHDSQFLKPPQHSFSDISSGGEPIHFPTVDPLDSLPLDRIKAEFLGRQFGVASFYLPGVTKVRDHPDVLRASERLVHLLFLHDIQLWGAWLHETAMEDIWEVANRYGIDDSAEYFPYWDFEEGNRREMAVSDTAVKVSVYKPARKKLLLLTVYNTGDHVFKGKLAIDWNALGDTRYGEGVAEIVSGTRTGVCSVTGVDAKGIMLELGAKDGVNIVVTPR